MEWYLRVQKNPRTDAAKKSKKGRLKTCKDWSYLERFHNTSISDPGFDEAEDFLVTVFLNGESANEYDFADVRANAEILPEEYMMAPDESFKHCEFVEHH
jgi:hypothetical protein